jgi:NAD(P)-dependent dehydrogenase (short-subunit alcohol dehydrogenase family)
MPFLKDRAAVITGAGSGIGRATSLRFAREGAGIVAVDRDEDALRTLVGEARGAISSVVGDIADPALPERIGAALGPAGGSIDIFVNCAAMGGGKVAGETTDAELGAFLSVNVVAQFRLSRFALERMGKGGVIINVGSMFGEVGATAMAAYSISKAAVSGMTRQMATDYGPLGIRVVAIAPGLIETPRTIGRMRSDEWLVANLVGQSALRRAGTAEEVAGVIAFLASDDAAFITGATIPVDGGWGACRFPSAPLETAS